MKVEFAEITAPSPDLGYGHGRWDRELKGFCSFRHSSRKRGNYPNWNEIRGPGYHLWFSEPLWDAARSTNMIRIEVLHPSTSKGSEIFEAIVAVTLGCLPRSEIAATGIEDV